MKIMILKIMAPVIAIFVAVIVAIILQSSEKKPTTIQGYLEGGVLPCSLSIICSDIKGELCTIKINDTIRQAFGKNSPFPTDCTKVLYKP